MPREQIVEHDKKAIQEELQSLVGKEAVYHERPHVMRVGVLSATSDEDGLYFTLQRIGWNGEPRPEERFNISVPWSDLVYAQGPKLIMLFNLPWIMYPDDELVEDISALMLAGADGRTVWKRMNKYKGEHWPV